MKIAYFNANLKVGQDGVTRVVYKMIDGALARNHDVMAFTSTLPEESDKIVPMHKVPSLVLPLQKNYRIAIPGYQSFARVLNEFRPDIIHINSPCTLGFGAVKYARHFEIPIVATYHTHFPAYPRYYNLSGLENLTWKILRRLYNNVNRTFVPTRPILRELVDHDIHRVKYLPNGVDGSLFTPTRRSQQWRNSFGNGEKQIVLFVSRLVWEKDLRVLANAYEILRSKRSDFEMVIVGTGNAKEEFQKIMPAAHFLGYKAGIELAESFASSDLFVFPSTTETFGLVTLEAMASGVVPVAAAMGGAVDIIEDGKSGLLCAPHNGFDMATKIEWLLDHPRYRSIMSDHAYQRSHEYHWDNILVKLFEQYEDVIESFKHKGAANQAA